MAPYIKYALVPVFIAASAFGGYTTIGSMITNGFSDVIKAVATGARATLIGSPEPFRRVYTGVVPVDRHLTMMVGFFSALLDGAVPPERRLFSGWVLGQFGAGWTIVLLEGLRAGNRDRAVGSIATLGLLFQNLGWTFCIPLWLVLHLLTSPVARLRSGDGAAARRELFVYLWDLALIPVTVTATCLAPSVFMALPDYFGQSPAAHYGLLAIWQLFPLWNVLAQRLLHAAMYYGLGSLDVSDERGEKTTPGKGYLTAASGVYQYALTLAVASHLPILALSVLPTSLRAALAARFPAWSTVIQQGTFANIFVPPSPFNLPTVNPTAYQSGELSGLAVQFLQYDLLVASVPLLLWALYLHQTTIKNPSLTSAFKKITFWYLVGGPHAPVVALLQERDAVVLEGDQPKKTN
ncbi:hypothetical protein BX600DRAFT_223948 [Xylariales sp. PMI_506]|nr:hypothetical protein BX600DRAFT_223948 [Xylariales sp. PMI_506]